MSKLILPDGVKSTLRSDYDQRHRDALLTQAYGNYKDEVEKDQPLAYRHALNHWICHNHGWTCAPLDWCPTCNGQLKADFDKFLAELQEKQHAEAEAERLKNIQENLQPVLDAADAEGKLLTFPTPESGND